MLKEQIEKEFLEAYKSRDEKRLSTLRMLKSAIKNTEIEKRTTVSDDDVVKIIRKEIKQRQESIIEYEKAGRTELVSKEQEEITVLQTYLPTELSEDEICSVVQDIITETGAKDISQMGRIIGAAMAKMGSAADGSKVAQIVRKLLQKS